MKDARIQELTARLQELEAQASRAHGTASAAPPAPAAAAAPAAPAAPAGAAAVSSVVAAPDSSAAASTNATVVVPSPPRDEASENAPNAGTSATVTVKAADIAAPVAAAPSTSSQTGVGEQFKSSLPEMVAAVEADDAKSVSAQKQATANHQSKPLSQSPPAPPSAPEQATNASPAHPAKSAATQAPESKPALNPSAVSSLLLVILAPHCLFHPVGTREATSGLPQQVSALLLAASDTLLLSSCEVWSS